MKKLLIVLIILLFAGVGIWLGLKPYRNWKQDRFLAQSRAFLLKSDYRNAAFSARQTLALNPRNAEACRMMARINEAVKSPDAVPWLARVVEFDPANTSNRLDLARCSLAFGNPKAAEQALRGVKEADRDSVDYHGLAALTASANGNLSVAEAHCARAAQIDPQNKSLQYNLCAIRLQSKDTKIRDEAFEKLRLLAESPVCRRDSLRLLVMTEIKKGDFAAAESFSKKLDEEQPIVFEDRILRLNVLKGASNPEAAFYLATLQESASRNPQELNTLAGWMRNQRMTVEALKWLLSLPKKMQMEPVTAAAIADCYSDLGQWDKLQALLENKQWGDLEFLRFAMLSRALRKQNDELKSKVAWNSAVAAAKDNLTPQNALLNMADAWGWEREKTAIAWSIVQHFPGERRVLAMLYKIYTDSGNTRGLQKIYGIMMSHDPKDLVAKNNYAAISLLLKSDVGRALDIARESYTANPKDGVLASTYAYALHLQGRTKEGLALFEKLKADQFKDPSVATYYGVLLSATGQRQKAAQYLEVGRNATMLPEEKQLIAEALQPASNPK